VRHDDPTTTATADDALLAVAEQLDAGEYPPSCRDCGASMVFETCTSCDEGYTPPGLLHEVEPDWYDEDDVEPCELCEEKGGWWCCFDQACNLKRLDEKRAKYAELQPAASDDGADERAGR
jgi:hypothetical protein